MCVMVASVIVLLSGVAGFRRVQDDCRGFARYSEEKEVRHRREQRKQTRSPDRVSHANLRSEVPGFLAVGVGAPARTSGIPFSLHEFVVRESPSEHRRLSDSSGEHRC